MKFYVRFAMNENLILELKNNDTHTHCPHAIIVLLLLLHHHQRECINLNYF